LLDIFTLENKHELFFEFPFSPYFIMDNKESVTWHYKTVKLEIKAGDMHLPLFVETAYFLTHIVPLTVRGLVLSKAH